MELEKTNIPEDGDVLTEIPTIGDCIQYPPNIPEDSELMQLLEELEGFYMDGYYHEEY